MHDSAPNVSMIYATTKINIFESFLLIPPQDIWGPFHSKKAMRFSEIALLSDFNSLWAHQQQVQEFCPYQLENKFPNEWEKYYFFA